MPRRAWQRRRLRPDATGAHHPAGSISQEQPVKRAGVPLTQNRPPRARAKRNNRNESSSSSESDTDSDEEYGETSRSVSKRSPRSSTDRHHNHIPVLGDETDPSSDSDSDSDSDSGYCSLEEEDDDEKAEYYDQLIERFRREGPTLANHGKNTTKMEEEQEVKWNKQVSVPRYIQGRMRHYNRS